MKTLLQTLLFYLMVTQICVGQWYPQNSSTTQHLRAVHFVDPDNGWAIGDSGLVLHTSDGGTNWTGQSNGIIINLISVYFTDSNTGWAVGDEGIIIKTIDSGNNWVSQNSGTTYPLYSVYFTDSNTGWVVGYYGTILKTSDGGNNWTIQSSGTTNPLYSVYFTDSNTGWTVGDYGTILHTTNGGLTYIEEEEEIDATSTTYSLSNSFPNPFNPTTTISYQLPLQRHVLLKVHDILGREVATLVNEVKQPGTYTVQFNASGLASGVYFYRLNAGSFVDVKKFLLVK